MIIIPLLKKTYLLHLILELNGPAVLNSPSSEIKLTADLVGLLVLPKLLMTESVSKLEVTLYYLLLILLVVVLSSMDVCLWDVTVVKSLLRGTFSIKPVLLLVVKWEVLIPVILTPCHNANIMFPDLRQVVQTSHKSNQNVPRNANLVMLNLGKKMKPKLLVVHME
jgi:hypothetical protein